MQCSYTFRLVYAGKKIDWLGQYGNNGVIHVDRTPLLHLADGWAERDGEYIWNGNSTEVAQIRHQHDYAVWAFGGDRYACRCIMTGRAIDLSPASVDPPNQPCCSWFPRISICSAHASIPSC